MAGWPSFGSDVFYHMIYMYYEFVGRVYPMEKINVVSVVPHHGVSHHILGPVPCAEASAEGKRPISFKNRDHGA